MKVSELKNLLNTIHVATTDQILVYSKVLEDAESFTFISFSAGFDIFNYLADRDIYEVSSGKVLKSSLTDIEIKNLQETGLGLALNGTFCTITPKALIELCVLLGIRGFIVSKPSSTRDSFIASLIKGSMHFVYTQGEHPMIVGISNKKYNPDTFFKTMNDNLEALCGQEAFSSLSFENGIEINYRYPSINGVIPIIILRDKVHGSCKYEIDIKYDINGFKVPMYHLSGASIAEFCKFLFEKYSLVINNITNFFKHVSFDFEMIKHENPEQFEKIQEANITTVPELIKFAKEHYLHNEIVAQLIKSAFPGFNNKFLINK